MKELRDLESELRNESLKSEMDATVILGGESERNSSENYACSENIECQGNTTCAVNRDCNRNNKCYSNSDCKENEKCTGSYSGPNPKCQVTITHGCDCGVSHYMNCPANTQNCGCRSME